MKNVLVCYEKDRFCGWPANNGMWSWGNELLVGFSLGYYRANETHHSLDGEKPSLSVFARSLDGGETWELQKNEDSIGEVAGGLCPGDIEFTHPDLAVQFRGNHYWISYDRGKNWEGYELPRFGDFDVMPRTDYIVNSDRDCFIFLTATKTDGKQGRPFCARTEDGGKTLRFVSWIAPEPTGFSIMPSTVRLADGRLLTAVRRREGVAWKDVTWIETYIADPDGLSWQFRSRSPGDTGIPGGNPPSMIRLSDGRICLVYGRRREPFGVRAVLSSDNGSSWSDEVILRDDGRTWDIGYPRTLQRPDGKVVTTYYLTTASHVEQHIAATIWDPDDFR